MPENQRDAPSVTAPAALESGSELLSVLEFYRRWWRLLTAITLLTTVVTALVICAKGAAYEVSAALYYKLGPELVPPPSVGGESILVMRRQEDVKNEIEILDSPHLIHQVVQDLGEGYFTAPPPKTWWSRMKRSLSDGMGIFRNSIDEALILAGLHRRLSNLEKTELSLRSQLTVEPVLNSDVVSVTLTTPSPEAGIFILEKLLDAYLTRHLAAHQNSGVREFFTEQTDELRARLSDSAATLLEFQLAQDLWSAEEQRKLLLERRKLLQTQYASTISRTAFLESEVAALVASIKQAPEEIQLTQQDRLNPAIDRLEDRLASLNLGLAVVEAVYIEGTRDRSNRERQIRGLRDILKEQPFLVPYSSTTGVNQTRQELVKQHAFKAAELTGLRDQLAVEETQLDSINTRLHDLETAITRFHQLKREHDLLEQNYQLYSENHEKSRISAVMNLAEISNVKIISPPTSSLTPVRPSLKLLLAAAIFVGFALGTVIAVLLDLRRFVLSRAAAVAT